jgi:hypothetical protein
MSTALHEPVQVGVVFQRGMAKPVWFIRQGRRYEVRHVTMRWTTREGRATLLHFAVTDAANTFELAFNQETLAWHLLAVEPGEGA